MAEATRRERRQRTDVRAAVVLVQAPGLALRYREVHCCCLDGGAGWAASAILIGSPWRQPPVQSSQPAHGPACLLQVATTTHRPTKGRSAQAFFFSRAAAGDIAGLCGTATCPLRGGWLLERLLCESPVPPPRRQAGVRRSIRTAWQWQQQHPRPQPARLRRTPPPCLAQRVTGVLTKHPHLHPLRGCSG